MLGLGNLEDCIEDGLNKAETSREIKKVHDDCKKEYPNARSTEDVKKNRVNVPLVPVPKVPLVVLPLIPLVPVPTQ